MLFCACLAAPIFTVTTMRSESSAIALFSLAVGAHSGWSANIFTTPSDMFPRSAVGSVVGIGGMAGSVGAILLATSAGYILQRSHSYVILLGLASSAYLLAFAIILLLAPGLKRVELTG
jgi:ACS family hexuronate transporter-like MFS transporter